MQLQWTHLEQMGIHIFADAAMVRFLNARCTQGSPLASEFHK
jgi:hypothetical protein